MYKRWIKFYSLVISMPLIAVGITIFLDYKGITFSQNTYLWFSSTISQTFGALIAIIITIGITQKIALPDIIGYSKDLKERQKRIWEELEIPIVIMAITIILSLLSIMVVNSSFNIPNFYVLYGFLLLFLYSLSSIIFLINIVTKIFTDKL